MTTLPRNAMVVRAPSDLPVSLAPAARFHRDPQGSTSIHIIFSQPDRHRIATQMWALQQQRLDLTRLFSRVDFLAQGRPSDWLHLYAAVRFSLRVLFAQRTAGASRHPAFPAPSWLRGWSDEANLGRNAPRERGCASGHPNIPV